MFDTLQPHIGASCSSTQGGRGMKPFASSVAQNLCHFATSLHSRSFFKKNKIELKLELCLQFEIYSPDTEFLAIFCNDGLLEVNTFLIDR